MANGEPTCSVPIEPATDERLELRLDVPAVDVESTATVSCRRQAEHGGRPVADRGPAKLDDVNGNDSQAKDVASRHPRYISDWYEAAGYLRQLKERQKLAGG